MVDKVNKSQQENNWYLSITQKIFALSKKSFQFQKLNKNMLIKKLNFFPVEWLW